MLFLPTLRCLWWFGSYNTPKAMVDYLGSVKGWQEEATFFSNEPIEDLFSLHEVATSEKAFNEVVQPISSIPDLGLEDGWLDEWMYIIDDPDSLLSLQNEAESLMNEDGANLLESWMDTNLDTSCLPSESNTDEKEECGGEFILSFDDNQPETTSGASYSSSVELDPYSPVSSVTSPTSSIDSSGPSDSPVSVTVYDAPVEEVQSNEKKLKPLKISKVFSISELSRDVRQKLQSSGKIPSVHVSLKQPYHPYSPAKSSGSKPRKENRYERKKVQNKEAAARYRIKKRMEEKELSDVVSGLEREQKDLQEKHDQLASEIKYLKKLMQEMFKAKGLL